MTAEEARQQCMTVFNDSAAMPGNECAMEEALDEYRAQVILDAASWLGRGAPVAAKWLRDDYLGRRT